MMKMKWLIPTLILFLVLPWLAVSAEKSVIVGFKQTPGLSEQTLIRKARGKIKRSHLLIPAMTASLPAEEIAKLRKNSKIAYVEENAVYAVAPEPPAGNEVGNGGLTRTAGPHEGGDHVGSGDEPDLL